MNLFNYFGHFYVDEWYKFEIYIEVSPQKISISLYMEVFSCFLKNSAYEQLR